MGFLDFQNVPEMSFGANTLGSNVWAAFCFGVIPTYVVLPYYMIAVQNHLKMDKRCRDENCQLSKSLEQGRVVCCIGLNRHRYRHIQRIRHTLG